jgi:hypothetical protein
VLSTTRASQKHPEQKQEQNMTSAAPAQATSETLPVRNSEDRPIDRPSAILKGKQFRNSVQAAQCRNHRFFLTMAILAITTVFVGYFPTYFQKPLESVIPLGPSPGLATIIHIHAAVMTVYFVFYVLQTALVSVNRTALHMTLGWASVVLIPTIVTLGTVVVFYGAKLGHKGIWPDPEVAVLVFVLDVYVFAALASTAILLRAKTEAHKRLMLLAIIAGLLPPALARSPLIHLGPFAVAAAVFAFLLAGPVYDLVTQRRIHPAYLWGLLFVVATMPPTRLALGHTTAWHHFVDWAILTVN